MADRKPRLLFYVLHLLGVGHVYRAKRLIEAFDKEGLVVDIVYGGMPLEDMSFAAESIHYLPPIRAEDATYKRYLDTSGKELSVEYLEKRKAVLLHTLANLEPDAILTEAFPFGRRVIRGEMDALFKAAAERVRPPLIVSSVRDILQEKRKPGRSEEARDWVQDRFDRVLVHSDPNIIRLNATFPLAHEIGNKLAYTGFVVPPSGESESVASFDIIVSAGGGGFGAQLMQTALLLANEDVDRRWCLATGPNLDIGTARELRNNAAPNVTIVEHLDNLSEHMKRAKISISQCGYNTAMDALAAHEASDCRVVFVPHDTTGQTEQLRRAQLLAQTGYAVCLPESGLSADRLNNAIERAGVLPKVDRKIEFDGAANSAKLLRKWIEQSL